MCFYGLQSNRKWTEESKEANDLDNQKGWDLINRGRKEAWKDNEEQEDLTGGSQDMLYLSHSLALGGHGLF